MSGIRNDLGCWRIAMGHEKKVSEKRPYSSPTLWVHGGIEELTQTSTHMGTKVDIRGKGADRTR